ncbi:MAG: hypothetical protein AYK19_07465 [Theionarchaea archaeon DG-70-1]|nr:MAG: hypothetical protein AYK19_07465 [Theionarchaea archaeon DG-70-1]
MQLFAKIVITTPLLKETDPQIGSPFPFKNVTIRNTLNTLVTESEFYSTTDFAFYVILILHVHLNKEVKCKKRTYSEERIWWN